MSVGSHAEKFNIVSYDRGRMQMCDFSDLDQNTANLIQKIKIVSLD